MPVSDMTSFNQKSKRSRLRECIALWGTLTLAVLIGTGQTQALEDHESLLVAFERYSDKLRDRDQTPWIRLYDSGELLVYYPHYKRRAGLYQTFLDADEISEILQSLTDAQLSGSSAALTAQLIRSDQLVASRPGVHAGETIAHYRSEAIVSRISSRTADGFTTIELANLQTDAGRVPSNHLDQAARAERSLMALANHPALVWVQPPSMPAGAP